MTEHDNDKDYDSWIREVERTVKVPPFLLHENGERVPDWEQRRREILHEIVQDFVQPLVDGNSWPTVKDALHRERERLNDHLGRIEKKIEVLEKVVRHCSIAIPFARRRGNQDDLDVEGESSVDWEFLRSQSVLPLSGSWNERARHLAQFSADSRQRLRERRKEAGRIRLRREVLGAVIDRFNVYGRDGFERDRSTEQDGRRAPRGPLLTIEDPDKHPREILQFLIDWTGEKSNRHKHFLSRHDKAALCNSISERLERETGEPVPPKTIKSRLRTIVKDGLGIELGSYTKVGPYFDARDKIKRATEEFFETDE